MCIKLIMSASLALVLLTSGTDADDLDYAKVFLHYLNEIGVSNMNFDYDFGSTFPPYLKGKQQVAFWEGFDLMPGSSLTHPDTATSIFTANVKHLDKIGIMANNRGERTYMNGCRITVQYKVTKDSQKVSMEPTSLIVTSCQSLVFNDGTGDHPMPYAKQAPFLKAVSKVFLERARLYFSFVGGADELKPTILDAQRLLRLTMFKTARLS